MEINFSELNNTDYTPDKYWETYANQTNNQPNNQNNSQPNNQTNNQPNIKKKKVSFDDILSNMNLVVNNKGVLQYMQPVQDNEYPQEEQPYQEYVIQQQQQQREKLDPGIKNSFLYNKYFKDYKDVATFEPEIRVPKTMEEYRQMLIEDKIKQLQHKKRIAEIKSTKMMFTTNNDTNRHTIKPTINHLRNMSFH